ncbi:MAG: universal stress protein family protein [Saliniramus fredricksonii]|jgi:nucleotide-binding universal stress UspA family protein|uniref:Universal stress protein family protein n=1 Tax=Saliniramus fredricksonii TaxID=1653334 RepID=A0A0P8BRD4_9HYPH|nr:MAG: universal stress protein family protein [Saliniramus fredricksonii]
MSALVALIDGSIYSQSVCDHTAWVAQKTGYPVELMHVLGRRDVSTAPADLSGAINADARENLLAELASHDEERARLAQKRGRLILEEARARIGGQGVEQINTRLRNGDLVEALQEAESDAALVIVGKRGEAADFARMHLGSNLERVVRASRKPVLVTSRAFKPQNRFLIAFDGGDSVMKAVRHIAAGKLFTGMECRLLTVGQPSAMVRERLETAQSVLRDAGFTVSSEIREGQPESVIITAIEAEKIDLLVMGAYGHSRIRSLIIGSTTSEMVRSCLVPVMLFR